MRGNLQFLLAQFLEFDVNVFKAILSIQRFFNLTEYREVIGKNSLLITHTDLNSILVAAANERFIFQIIDS